MLSITRNIVALLCLFWPVSAKLLRGQNDSAIQSPESNASYLLGDVQANYTRALYSSVANCVENWKVPETVCRRRFGRYPVYVARKVSPNPDCPNTDIHRGNNLGTNHCCPSFSECMHFSPDIEPCCDRDNCISDYIDIECVRIPVGNTICSSDGSDLIRDCIESGYNSVDLYRLGNACPPGQESRLCTNSEQVIIDDEGQRDAYAPCYSNDYMLNGYTAIALAEKWCFEHKQTTALVTSEFTECGDPSIGRRYKCDTRASARWTSYHVGVHVEDYFGVECEPDHHLSDAECVDYCEIEMGGFPCDCNGFRRLDRLYVGLKRVLRTPSKLYNTARILPPAYKDKPSKREVGPAGPEGKKAMMKWNHIKKRHRFDSKETWTWEGKSVPTTKFGEVEDPQLFQFLEEAFLTGLDLWDVPDGDWNSNIYEQDGYNLKNVYLYEAAGKKLARYQNWLVSKPVHDTRDGEYSFDIVDYLSGGTSYKFIFTDICDMPELITAYPYPERNSITFYAE